MRGVDLNVFEFDYDLTWAAFFLNGSGRVYGRFGGRDTGSPDKYLTLPGLKHAMRSALTAHREPQPDQSDKQRPRTVETYPAARKLKADACIHCHQAYDFRRELLESEGRWSRDEIWVHPLPENIGVTVNAEQGDRVRFVQANSPAARAGLRAGDVLKRIGDVTVASFADVQYALHQAPRTGKINVTFERAGKRSVATLELAQGWRQTDISWRESMWGLSPQASVYGKDLDANEKKQLGLSEKQLAFRQGNFVPIPARQAGIRQNDIVLGIDGKKLEMTMLQFNAHVRLDFKVGDQITFNIIRDGKRLDVPMTLPGKRPF